MTTEAMHIHLDLVGGLAGDMFCGAAIDAGVVKPAEIQSALRSVGLGPVEVTAESALRGAIAGTHVSFDGWSEEAESDHRHLSTIRTMLADSDLDRNVSRRAIEMFERLGAAESRVHGVELEEVHFHEVGAVDSILDFVAAAYIIEKLEATWSVGPIPAGRGTIETDHGTIPVPAPATLRVLEGFELRYRDVEAELVTPTGATIAATVAELDGPKRGVVKATGFGCGSRDPKGVSNVVRFAVLTGGASAKDAAIGRDEIVRLVTEIDDQSPEEIAYAAVRLLEQEAVDVVTEPVRMKKGRDGIRLSVLCRPDDEQRLVERMFEETTTLGVRRMTLQRWVLDRQIVDVDTPFGEVSVKVAGKGRFRTVAPEYESCVCRAEERDVPLREVFLAARSAAEEAIAAGRNDE